MPVEEALTSKVVALVSAHPDDETVSAGGMLARMRDPVIVEVTDGAPRNLADARAAGYQTREEYAEARRLELLNALDVCGHPAAAADPESADPPNLIWLNAADQEASFDMEGLARRIAGILQERRPGAVLTHAYEGGHPDHDATAFAVHVALAVTPAPVELYEFTSYHAYPGRTGNPPGMETGRFLAGQEQGKVVTLSDDARERKARAIDCFATQLHMLRRFAVDVERFRAAPAYDFTQPPHPGKLFYEYFDWGVTGERWRSLAAEAARKLGIPGTL
jgi:LmbE family N-acetylglucosaminyl deacetylase